MNYYEHHIGDYAAATAHLSWDEDMAYTRLLRAYFHNEKGIPDGQQYRMARATTPAQRRAVDAVIAEFFRLVDGVHIQKRAEEQIAEYLAGEPEREAKKANETARLKRHREERARLFKLITDAGMHAAWNIGMNELRELAKRCGQPLPETAPATPATATQTPYTIPKVREEATSDDVACARPPDEPPADPQPALTLVKPAQPLPDCPHLEVLALWAEVLPAMPQHDPEHWRGTRADHLRARWRECAAGKGWTSRAQGLSYFRKLFAYVGQSEFLTGRASRQQPGRRPFVAELEWLVKPTNWAKVHEGKYHQEDAA